MLQFLNKRVFLPVLSEKGLRFILKAIYNQEHSSKDFVLYFILQISGIIR